MSKRRRPTEAEIKAQKQIEDLQRNVREIAAATGKSETEVNRSLYAAVQFGSNMRKAVEQMSQAATAVMQQMQSMQPSTSMQRTLANMSPEEREAAKQQLRDAMSGKKIQLTPRQEAIAQDALIQKTLTGMEGWAPPSRANRQGWITGTVRSNSGPLTNPTTVSRPTPPASQKPKPEPAKCADLRTSLDPSPLARRRRMIDLDEE